MRIHDLLASSPVLALREHPRSARTIQRAAADGLLVPILPGVFVRKGLEEEPATRLRAVSAWSSPGAVHARTAVELYTGEDVSMPIQLRSPHRDAPVPWLKVARGSVPPEFRRRLHGVTTVTPAYACLECATCDHGRSAFDFLRRRLVTPADLAATLPAFDRTHGNAERRRVATQAIRNPWSFAEARLQDLLIGAGITGWVANEPLRLGPVLLLPDIWFPELRLVIEFDGKEIHTDHLRFENDRWRQNLLVTEGFRVLRVTWQMLMDEPFLVLQLVQAAIALT